MSATTVYFRSIMVKPNDKGWVVGVGGARLYPKNITWRERVQGVVHISCQPNFGVSRSLLAHPPQVTRFPANLISGRSPPTLFWPNVYRARAWDRSLNIWPQFGWKYFKNGASAPFEVSRSRTVLSKMYILKPYFFLNIHFYPLLKFLGHQCYKSLESYKSHDSNG